MDAITWIFSNMPTVLQILAAIYGLLTLIVKLCPTLSNNHPLLWIIKLLGKITNSQVDHAAERAKVEPTK
jgi:ABC-type amino acid transport system permease subunit